MLNIYLGEMEGAVYHPPVYFDNRYEDEWLAEPLATEMVKDVDKSEIISPHLVQSPVLGPISVKELSGGVKTLMLMAFDKSGKVFNASACGDNCAKWILKIAEGKELTIKKSPSISHLDESIQRAAVALFTFVYDKGVQKESLTEVERATILTTLIYQLKILSI